MERIILHCDCNSFFASVETVLRPELGDGPMAVCGDPESRHGIILAKNDAAKRYGVTTAETIWSARRKCPGLRLVPPHHEAYQQYSKEINAIYESMTDLVEPFGIDESWLDLTGSAHLFGTGAEMADLLRRRIREETGLTVSVGVSFNKIFAKLGSDYKKPDATTIITRENFRELLWPLPVTSMLYVGEASKKVLAELYVTTIGQLAQCGRARLAARLGRLGEQLHDYANGLDESPVRSIYEPREVKSVGSNMTFRRNLVGSSDLRLGVEALADEVAFRLRRQGLVCQTVQLLIKDPAFRTISRQKRLERPTALAAELAEAALELAARCQGANVPVRMLSVTATGLLPAGQAVEQMSLFDTGGPTRQRRERLETTLDAIRGRYGRTAVASAAALGSDLGLTERRPEDDEPGGGSEQ